MSDGYTHRISDIKFMNDIYDKLYKYLPNGKIRDNLAD